MMHFKLKILPDENYYNEAYSEIISTFKYKKYEPIFAIILVLFGVGLYLYDSHKVFGLFSLAFSVAGIYELCKFYSEKNRWIKNRLKNPIIGQHLEIEFNDDSIKHNGPFSNGEMYWHGLKNIVKTRSGLLLKLHNRISIYLPDKNFDNQEQIDFIISKKNDCNQKII